MLSRDTRVHLVVLAVAVAGFVAAQLIWGGIGTGTPGLLALAVFYGVAFGGAHLYLAVRGEDGLVPPDARWRYVGFLAALLVVGVAVALVGGDRTVGSVRLRALGWGLIGLLVAAYLVVEGRDGYRTTVES